MMTFPLRLLDILWTAPSLALLYFFSNPLYVWRIFLSISRIIFCPLRASFTLSPHPNCAVVLSLIPIQRMSLTLSCHSCGNNIKYGSIYVSSFEAGPWLFALQGRSVDILICRLVNIPIGCDYFEHHYRVYVFTRRFKATWQDNIHQHEYRRFWTKGGYTANSINIEQ